ncbi:MAG: cupin domain-containing protein [Leptospiraceae bacterium]|nr:cupin domain-containing protein [Leptospiraceae bacterium]
MKLQNQSDFDAVSIFGTGSLNEAYARYFDGQSWLNPLIQTGVCPVALFHVSFEPGSRNHWHIHHAATGGGQLLICTAGEGWYQKFGQPAVSLKEGSIAFIPANVKHWHGARADSWFSHIALELPGTEQQNQWLEPLDLNEYTALHN